MSLGTTVPFDEAVVIAQRIAELLRPHVRRIKAAGSLRRRRAHVHDLEFVIEPQMHADLFGGETPVLEPIRRIAGELGEVLKNGDRYIQVDLVLDRPQFLPKVDLRLDLYLCHPPAEWGSTLAIRTGPAQLGHFAMMQLNRWGFSHRDGGIYSSRTGEKIEVPDEETFFRLAHLPCLPPTKRDAPSAMTPTLVI